MNGLSQYLVDIILEKDTPIKNVVVVYSGRFQLFHHGHYDSYQKLVNKFGKDSVYIGTSNKVEAGRSPFSFKEKVEIMTRMFDIPKNRIVQVKNPYAPTEILKKYDPETTAYVTFVSTKDINRLVGKYFRKWDGEPTAGYKEAGYVFALPPGGRGVSGTEVRQGLSVDDDEKRREFFKQIYPKFDQRIYNLITKKLNEVKVIPKDLIEEWVITKFPQIIKEASIIGGGAEVDDGPNFLYPSFSTFNRVAKNRAEQIGFTLATQIKDGRFEDIEVFPRYPHGPVPAVTPYPAGVIGKVTATNQKDFASMEAYDKWLKHVTRKMALVGYELVHHRDDVERELSTKYLDELDKVIQLHLGKAVTLDDIDVGFEDMIQEGLMIGYEGSEDYKERQKKLADLRKRLDKFNKKNIKEEDLTEALNKLKLNIPKDIKDIHNAFKREGKKLYVVGGAVRDAILGGTPKDFDLATDAHPEVVLAIAKKHGFHTTEVGKAFGVVLVNGNEIATFRRDIGKGRKPSSVDYTDIEGDVRRRDLTINALFYDIDRKEIVDLVGGITDLKKNRVRTVGDAKERFDEDPLRKLRALRFAARLGAKLDKATEEAIAGDPTLSGVSAERIRDEFIKSIQSAKSTKTYLEIADRLKILPLVFPNLKYNRKDFINQNDYILLIAYLFRNYTPIRLEKTLIDLKYANAEAASVRFLLQLAGFKPDDIVALKRLQPNVDITDSQILEWGRMIGQDFRKFVSFKLTVSGKEVMAMGYKGKDIGDKIRDMERERFLSEAAFPIKPGFRFQANKNFQSVKKGSYYIVKDILGRIGDLTVLLLKTGTKKIVPVNVRSVEELYKYAIMKESLQEKGITDFKSLFKTLPPKLQKRVYALKDVPQRLDYHPEGNTLKHTIMVVNRALKDDDMDMAIAAMFHDIGKDETAEFNPKTGYFSHHGHEKVSAQLVKEYKDWIKEMGGNPANIYYIVRNHMRFKQLTAMRPGKKKKLKAFRAYDKLQKFSKHDRGGLDENKEQITEGGSYGHLSHPFETDINLSFGQLKDIINTALDGKLKLAREKTDGQQISVSWIDGEIRAARNKSHLKDYGKNSMTIAQVASKFAGRGDLTDGFNKAMADLSDAISSLTDKQREKIFANGKKFMSLEIMYPANTNVIPYGHSLLVFHGALEYDEQGNAIGEDTKAGRILAGMIKQINKDVQQTFSIRSQPVIELPKKKEIKSLKPKYMSALQKLQKEFKLGNHHTVQDYHRAWWLDYIKKNAPVKLDDEVIKGLTNRWAIDDRSFRLNRKNIEDQKALEWAKKVDKNDLNKIRKQNFRKFEDIFLGVGADLLSFISSALVVNPDDAVRKMKDRLDKTVKDIRKKGDVKQIDILNRELERLEAIGGMDKIVPVEGIVFVGPDDRMMKLTGAFAPLNAILGIMTYSR